MTSHKKHLYTHKEYSVGFSVSKDYTPLPKDKRRKPYPSMRKYGIEADTWGEFSTKMIEYWGKRGREHWERQADMICGIHSYSKGLNGNDPSGNKETNKRPHKVK